MQYLLVTLLTATAAAWAVRGGRLTVPAAAWGFVLAQVLYAGAGAAGLLMMAAFFFGATAATAAGKREKQRLGLTEKGGRRNAAQVLANGGVGGLLAAASFFFHQYADVFGIAIGGAFSAAAADTLSSELGSILGRRYFHIITWKKDRRGLDGVVSGEGFAAGMAGSMLVAAVHACYTSWGIHFLFIVIAGTLGNIADSLLGATFERRGVLGNNAVNFLNTLTGAIAAAALFMAV